jgi:hypothetical protein
VKHRAVLGAVTAAAALGWIAWGPAAYGQPAACGAPTPIVPLTKSGLTNARGLGRLLWVAGGGYTEGYATKLLIAAKPHAHTRKVVLRGWRCSDRLPLRFWYRSAPPPFSGQVADSVLASTGDLAVKVPLRDMRRHRWQMTGYHLFSSPGTWVVKAYVGSRTVGAIVFDLR